MKLERENMNKGSGTRPEKEGKNIIVKLETHQHTKKHAGLFTRLEDRNKLIIPVFLAQFNSLSFQNKNHELTIIKHRNPQKI